MTYRVILHGVLGERLFSWYWGMAHYPRPRSTGVGCIDRRDQWRLFFLGPGLFTLTLGRGLFPGVGFAVCGFSGLGFRWCFACLQCFYLYLRNRDLSIFFSTSILTINTFFQKKILLRKSTLYFLWFCRYLNIPFSLCCYTTRLIKQHFSRNCTCILPEN